MRPVLIAQTAAADTAAPGSGLRISLLTCGPGDDIYMTFGHTAVRVVDSTEQGVFRDLVYNYGMFEGYTENFELKFMRGKLRYFVAATTYQDFVAEYTEDGRFVQEQELLIADSNRLLIADWLAYNALPANRYYKYDFFFDNCATRIRDIFPRVLGDGFRFGNVLPEEKPSFRDIMNRYFYKLHWQRVGVNILLGSKIDRKMTNEDIMFLPNYLRDAVAKSTLNGKPCSAPPVTIIPGRQQSPVTPNYPLWLAAGLLLLTVAGGMIPRLRLLSAITGKLALLVSGLLGCIILVMWFGTDHEGCSNNFNLLWALPTNLLLVFRKAKGARTYSAIAMLLIALGFVMDIAGVQDIIPELALFMFTLLFVFWNNYKTITRNKMAAMTSVNEEKRDDDALQ